MDRLRRFGTAPSAPPSGAAPTGCQVVSSSGGGAGPSGASLGGDEPGVFAEPVKIRRQSTEERDLQTALALSLAETFTSDRPTPERRRSDATLHPAKRTRRMHRDRDGGEEDSDDGADAAADSGSAQDDDNDDDDDGCGGDDGDGDDGDDYFGAELDDQAADADADADEQGLADAGMLGGGPMPSALSVLGSNSGGAAAAASTKLIAKQYVRLVKLQARGLNEGLTVSLPIESDVYRWACEMRAPDGSGLAAEVRQPVLNPRLSRAGTLIRQTESGFVLLRAVPFESRPGSSLASPRATRSRTRCSWRFSSHPPTPTSHLSCASSPRALPSTPATSPSAALCAWSCSRPPAGHLPTPSSRCSSTSERPSSRATAALTLSERTSNTTRGRPGKLSCVWHGSTAGSSSERGVSVERMGARNLKDTALPLERAS